MVVRPSNVIQGYRDIWETIEEKIDTLKSDQKFVT